jgi:exonuclease III
LNPLQAMDTKDKSEGEMQAGMSEVGMKANKVAEKDWAGGWPTPEGNFGRQVIEMLLRIEDRCDKTANKVTHIEERMMRLVYKEFEVIRIISQYVVEAKPEISKEWVKNHIRNELARFVEAQELQGKLVDEAQKGRILKGAMMAAQEKTKDMHGKGQSRVMGTIKDLQATCQASFNIQAIHLKNDKATGSI